MSKTESLRAALQSLLKTISTTVSYESVPIKTYPYLVFELEEVGKFDGKVQYQLEINAVDCGTDSSDVEELSDAVQELLHKYYHLDENIQFSSYQGIRHSVKEDDPKIIRRRMLFEVQLHELKGE